MDCKLAAGTREYDKKQGWGAQEGGYFRGGDRKDLSEG
jgi:hypothetical protein